MTRAACLAATMAVLTGCGGVTARAASGHDVAADARADALTTVARRLYGQEADGIPARAAVRRIARDRALVAAVSSGRFAAEHRAADHELFLKGRHVVRLGVTRGPRTVVDVGGAFVVAGARRELRAPDGRGLGELQASVQDVIGYVKLVRRLTGAGVVVRGADGHVEASPARLSSATLPASGRVTVDGRTCVVRSFRETGYAGEPLRIWILTPA